MPPPVSRTALLLLTVSVMGRVMPGSPMMQPVTLSGCRASVNTVTEPGSVVPAAGAAVLVGWLQPAISITVRSAEISLVLHMRLEPWQDLCPAYTRPSLGAGDFIQQPEERAL